MMVSETVKRLRGGQVKDPTERKRNNLTFRARDELKRELEAAASASGRSVSEEIEFRLEQSLAEKSAMAARWGTDGYGVADAVARAAFHAEQRSGKGWLADKATFQDFRDSLPEVVEAYRNLRSGFKDAAGMMPETMAVETASAMAASGSFRMAADSGSFSIAGSDADLKVRSP